MKSVTLTYMLRFRILLFKTHVLHGILGFLFGLFCPFLGHVEVSLNHGGQGVDVGQMTHVPVLEQSLLGHVGLAQVHAQLKILEHNLLQKFLRVRMVPFLALDDIVKGVQST